MGPAIQHTASSEEQQAKAASPPLADGGQPAAPGSSYRPETLRESLLADGKLDVYAYTVNCIIKGDRGKKVAQSVATVVFTFLLQMGLLILLLDAVFKGPAHGLLQLCQNQTSSGCRWARCSDR